MNSIISINTLLERKCERDHVRDILTAKPVLVQYEEAIQANIEASNDAIAKQNELISALNDTIESQDIMIKLYERYIVLLGGKKPTGE